MKSERTRLVWFIISIVILTAVLFYIFLSVTDANTNKNGIVEKNFEAVKAAHGAYFLIAKIQSGIMDVLPKDAAAKNQKMNEMKEYSAQMNAVFDKLHIQKPENKEDIDKAKTIFRQYMEFGTSILNFKDVNEFLAYTTVLNRFMENNDLLNTAMAALINNSSKAVDDALLDSKKAYTSSNLFFCIIIILLAIIEIGAVFLINRNNDKNAA